MDDHHDYLEALRLARHHTRLALLRVDQAVHPMDRRQALRDLSWRASVLAGAADDLRDAIARGWPLRPSEPTV